MRRGAFFINEKNYHFGNFFFVDKKKSGAYTNGCTKNLTVVFDV